jgi:hypothetical protein
LHRHYGKDQRKAGDLTPTLSYEEREKYITPTLSYEEREKYITPTLSLTEREKRRPCLWK